MKEQEFDVDAMQVVEASEDIQTAVDEVDEKKKKDPTPEELQEYFVQVKQKVKTLNIKGGAQEFTFDDGFSCVARDNKNADRKHQNWIDSQDWLKSKRK